MSNSKYTSHSFTSESSDLPVFLEDARAQLKLDDLRHDDEYLISLIKGQCSHIEWQYSCALLEKTVLEYHSGFPSLSTLPIRLHVAPASAVSSIQYIDSAGDTQTWSSSEYSVKVLNAGVISIIPKVSYCYPTDLAIRPDAVSITYTAGFGTTPSSIPAGVKLGILARIGRAYTQREDAPEYKTSMSDVLLHQLKRY